MGGFKLKTFGQITSSLINWFASAQSHVTDLNVGSVARTLLEAVASEISEVYYRIYTALTAAQAAAIYDSFNFPRKPAASAAGVVLWQTNGLPASVITVPISAQAAVPATSSSPELTFSAAASAVIPAQTTLAAAITTTGATSVTVTSAANMAAGDVVQVGSEKLHLTSVVGNVLTVVRGYQSTTAATHSNGTASGVVGKAVTMTADAVGSAGNVVAASISKLNTGITGIASVTNEAALTGGADVETDDQRKGRFQQYIRSLARGTKASCEFGAETVTGVVTAHAVDNDDDGSIPVGVVNLYIANAAGTAPAGLITAVEAEEVNWRPAGILVNVSAPSVVAIDVTAALSLAAGFDGTAVRTAVTQALTNYLTARTMAQPVYLAQLYRQIIDAVPSAIVNAVITVPSGDTAISNSQIARPGALTIT